jgi:biopolymer transport protein ExbD
MKKITLLFLCLILPLAISCTNPMKELAEREKSKENPNIPKNIKNAKPDKHAAEAAAITVTVLQENGYYINHEQYPLDVLGDKVKRSIEKTPAEKDLVYVNASARMDYLEFVKVADSLRKQDVQNIGLLVTPQNRAEDAYYTLNVKLTPEPKDDDSAMDLYPVDNKFVGFDRKKFAFSFGSYKDWKLEKQVFPEEELEAKISALLKEREEKKVLVKGTSEIDKRIFIRVPKSANFEQVARIVDAAAGAGASVVYLQIDDLPEE